MLTEMELVGMPYDQYTIHVLIKLMLWGAASFTISVQHGLFYI